jgi:glycosyltransferase involved in cell wall biosynthesis
LVPSGDIEALKKALANLAGDEPTRLRMGLAGRSRADRLFSADHHVDLMEAVLTSAGDESGG